MKIARRAIWFLRAVPFVRAVLVTNTVAAGCATETSDIDLLVVVKKGRLWLARFFVLSILELLRLRPNRAGAADKICPCFFLSEEALDLTEIRIPAPDIYLAYWILQAVPVYDPAGIHARLQGSNSWVAALIPRGLQPFNLVSRWAEKDARLIRLLRRFLEAAWQGVYGDILEERARALQRPRVERYYGEALSRRDTSVILSDRMLKFHRNDRRRYYRERWQHALTQSAAVFLADSKEEQ